MANQSETKVEDLEKKLKGLWEGVLETLPSDYLIDELKRRGKVLLDDSCPYCEADFEVPPELLLVDISGDKIASTGK